MNKWQHQLRQMKDELTAWLRNLSGGRGGENRPKIKMCPVCGNFVNVRAATCEYCQADLMPRVSASPKRGTGQAEPLNPTMVIFGICIFMMLIAIFLSSRVEGYELARKLWSPSGEVLARMGANYNERTVFNLEIWRICTYMFLHGNFMHIFFNLYALAQLGALTYRNFGSRRFWMISFLTGIGGGLLSALPVVLGHIQLPQGFPGGVLGWFFNFFGGPKVSTGFSGALFGFLGVNYFFFKAQGQLSLAESLKKYMVWGNIICIGLTITGLMPIDNAAHLGGTGVGLLLGWIYTSKYGNYLSERAERILVTSCLVFWGYGLYRSFFFVHEYFF